MKIIVYTFYMLLFSAIISGCGDSQAVKEQRAQLELAELKGDLDAIYMSLSRLSDIGDQEAKGRIAEITRVIEIREKMNQARSDHDHEDALLYASQLLDQMPKNNDAKKVVRESGQIFYYLVSAKELLRSLNIGSDEISVTPEKVKLDEELSDDEKSKALTILVQKQLNELDYNVGVEDGVAGKKTIAALTEFQKSNGLEENGEINIDLANQLYVGIAKEKERELREEERINDLEEMYENLRKARVYVINAKELDPHFKGSLEFENIIEQTQATLIYIHGNEVVKIGQSVVSSAAKIYSLASDYLSTAASLSFVSVQDAWSIVEGTVDEAKNKLEPFMDSLDDVGRMLATYDDGPAKEFAEATIDYIRIVRKTVDALMVPQGSYLDYSRAANKAATAYKDSQNLLVSSIPTSISIQDSVSGFIKVFTEFDIFKDDRTQAILNENSELYSL